MLCLDSKTAEGRLFKIDFAYWSAYQNDPAIGDFDVPWEPYGFNSGAGQIDFSREAAKAQGLNVEKHAKEEKLPSLNSGLSASTKKMDPALKKKLLDDLNGKINNPRKGAGNTHGSAWYRCGQGKMVEELSLKRRGIQNTLLCCQTDMSKKTSMKEHYRKVRLTQPSTSSEDMRIQLETNRSNYANRRQWPSMKLSYVGRKQMA
ncbi:hypothetical protein ACFSSA_08645 [Luteolibacter algae]|uniref:Uncharacterized protein n=1 Tax=Luteolibacter algae TaxID=454151 RepID=A0ABW5D794_9BACT